MSSVDPPPGRRRLAGLTAIVTGASRGIGLAAAQALHDDGANVVLTARTEAAAMAATTFVGERTLGFAAHVADGDAARACVDRTLDHFGSLDILINNAATNVGLGPVLEQSQAQFTKTMEVNVWAPILWTRLAVDAWMRDYGGRIVNTASIGGFIAGHDIGVYNVSKAAVIHLTGQLALELGPTIRVNAVAPGLVRTRMAEALWRDKEDAVAGHTLLARIGEPRDIAAAIAFLASDDSSWITGQTLVIDGGQMISSQAVNQPADHRSSREGNGR